MCFCFSSGSAQLSLCYFKHATFHTLPFCRRPNTAPRAKGSTRPHAHPDRCGPSSTQDPKDGNPRASLTGDSKQNYWVSLNQRPITSIYVAVVLQEFVTRMDLTLQPKIYLDIGT